MNENYNDIIAREIVTSRVFKVSRETLYRAWTTPEFLEMWWGPAGFTNTFQTYELKPQGQWKFVMHGPDGIDYDNECEFIEVIKPTKLSWKHLSEPYFQATVTFDEVVQDSAKITFRGLFNSAAECEMIKKYALAANEQTMEKLEALLEDIV